MAASIQRQWEHFAASPTGRRFETRHRLRRARKNGVLLRVLISSVAVLLLLAGLVMLVLPGPGLLALVIGAALLAEESLLAARMLDRLDLWISRKRNAWRARRQ